MFLLYPITSRVRLRRPVPFPSHFLQLSKYEANVLTVASRTSECNLGSLAQALLVNGLFRLSLTSRTPKHTLYSNRHSREELRLVLAWSRLRASRHHPARSRGFGVRVASVCPGLVWFHTERTIARSSTTAVLFICWLGSTSSCPTRFASQSVLVSYN